MKKKNPKVSVCIPTYNRTDLLKQSIESVLAQSFTDYELIISDNASEDSTVAIINSFSDPRIVYQRHQKNIGLVNNWNSCLAAASGEYVTIFHDDDLMLPENLALKVNALDLHRNVGLVHSNFNIIDESGSVTKESAHFIDAHDYIEAGPVFLRESLLGFNRINPPSAFMRKDCFLKIGGFNKDLHFTPDFEYWMRIAMHYDVMYLAKPLIGYRMYHSTGWTSSQYLTLVEGTEGPYAISSLKGIQEEYAARRIILRQTKGTMADWKKTNRLVRKNMISSLGFLFQNKCVDHRGPWGAMKSILKMCQAFPDLALDTSMAKLVLKVLLGRRLTETVRALSGKPLEGV